MNIYMNNLLKKIVNLRKRNEDIQGMSSREKKEGRHDIIIF